MKGSVEQLHRLVAADFPKAEAAAHRAIQLDPRNADAYAGLGNVQRQRHKLLDAEQSFKRGLSLDPLNPQTLSFYSLLLDQTGRIKETVAMREQLRSLEPQVPAFNSGTARILSVAGDNARALAIAEALPSDRGVRALDIAEIYAAMGRFNEAADATLNMPRERLPPGAVETAARLLRMAPAPATRDHHSFG